MVKWTNESIMMMKEVGMGSQYCYKVLKYRMNAGLHAGRAYWNI